jgi:hypothetical protein
MVVYPLVVALISSGKGRYEGSGQGLHAPLAFLHESASL